jgi:hypothetical protein
MLALIHAQSDNPIKHPVDAVSSVRSERGAARLGLVFRSPSG